MAHDIPMTLIIDGEWQQQYPLTLDLVRSAVRGLSAAQRIQVDELTFDAGQYDEPSAVYLEWCAR